MAKHQARLDKKGYVYFFEQGKPLVADVNQKEAIAQLMYLAERNPKKFKKINLVRVVFEVLPSEVNRVKRGGLVVRITAMVLKVTKDTYQLEPRDYKRSSVRFFYNRDEISKFKLSELPKFVTAVENRLFPDTHIGHFQYTEMVERIDES